MKLPPTIEDVQKALASMNVRQLRALAEMSGVGWTSLYKIKAGTVTNPGIMTVRSFLPHVSAAKRTPRA